MKKILVVDNYRPLRLLYQEELEKDGYNVSTAANVDNALEQTLRKNFDLIITEVRMPGKNGLDLKAKFLARRTGLRIIVYTAHDGYKSDFVGWAADAYLMKSSCLLELKKTIRELLESPASKPLGPPERSEGAGSASAPINVSS